MTLWRGGREGGKKGEEEEVEGDTGTETEGETEMERWREGRRDREKNKEKKGRTITWNSFSSSYMKCCVSKNHERKKVDIFKKKRQLYKVS